MNQLQVFQNDQLGQVRTINENGTVLFCGQDIAKALGYTNPRKAILDHCKGVTKRDTPTTSGTQEMSFIPEGDVYRLIARKNQQRRAVQNELFSWRHPPAKLRLFATKSRLPQDCSPVFCPCHMPLEPRFYRRFLLDFAVAF